MSTVPSELESFRQEVRQFLQEKLPDDLRRLTRTENMGLSTEQRFLFGPGGPDAMGPEASMLKVRGTEVQQEISRLTMEAITLYPLPCVPEQRELRRSYD